MGTLRPGHRPVKGWSWMMLAAVVEASRAGRAPAERPGRRDSVERLTREVSTS
jgi:hypothetical protein